MIGGFFARSQMIETVPMEPHHSAPAAEIHAAAFRRAWSAEEIDALLSQANVFGFVALAAGRSRVSGFVLVRFAADEAEVLTIAVVRKARNAGIGWRLMVAAIDRMRREGAEKMFLEVDEQNAAALALYRRLGFKTVAKRSAYYKHGDGTRSAALVMRCDLI